ncbi:amidase domain-containing protein [Serpentinicella alkaliphila]|uniref:Putative amidase-like protein n=1 Tax=Serpentinicella alkaliphila TaxID=1734049 RepID=A0A4R2TFC4_9FIRM|nr:amidase domain-containing protein [Serpentinicella alkaliphila]QUH25765.1 amidase domain-containing protein [Serpentinicella alkaliphila]TCP99764.1 putative amidase-like protein [Serpentinicella alkaliphila]
MIVIISKKKFTYAIIIILVIIVIFAGLMSYLHRPTSMSSFTELDEGLQKFLDAKINEIFEFRNSVLLKADTEGLDELYIRTEQKSLWAYEHEIKKMKYLHKWSEKQGVQFHDINSHIIIRSAQAKNEGYTLNLLVSTEYIYKYEDSRDTNSFRIGTYHSIDLMPHEEEGWIISKEWYTDPFADSLELDDIKSNKIKETIHSGTPKDLSNLNERRVKAVEYVDMYSGAASLPKYGFKYNSKYRNYNSLGGDCANFASQMLYEGAQFKKNRTWNYERGAGSKSWINAHGFNDYMLNSGRGSVIARGAYAEVLESTYKLIPGDYVAYEKQGKVTHISVVTSADSKGYALVNSHNSDRHRVPWDLGWSNKGIRFILVRVNY